MTDMTIIRCKCCGRELSSLDKEWCEKSNTDECTECVMLHNMGIYTIDQYNKWLRKVQTCPTCH